MLGSGKLSRPIIDPPFLAPLLLGEHPPSPRNPPLRAYWRCFSLPRSFLLLRGLCWAVAGAIVSGALAIDAEGGLKCPRVKPSLNW